MDGILIIDKPAGITSHDVVARCRRILRTKRIGHTGTLDPFATGVMVILVGRATRLAQFLDKDRKEYLALVRFGYETTTGDLTGEIKENLPANPEFEISKKALEAALPEFRGELEQTPPMYSAKKVDGRKLYELARKGIEIERKPARVNIYELEAEPENSLAPGQSATETDLRIEDRTLRVACSAGTYIRVLAEDIGRKLGAGAHLAALRRTRAGKFEISRSVSLEKLEETVAAGELEKILISTNEAVSHLAEIELSEEEKAKILNGVKLRKELTGSKNEDHLRLTWGGELLAVGIYREAEKTVQPKLVLV